MNIDLERATLEQFLANNLPAGITADKVSWDGVPFSSPADGSTFLEVQILDGSTNQITTGGDSYDKRTAGVLQIIVNTQPKGSAPARLIADALDATFSNQRFVFPNGAGCLRTRVPETKRLGVRDDRFLLAVSVPFLRDDYVRPQ